MHMHQYSFNDDSETPNTITYLKSKKEITINKINYLESPSLQKGSRPFFKALFFKTKQT